MVPKYANDKLTKIGMKKLNGIGLARLTMSRIAKPKSQFKMYRHFAVVTVAVTIIVGIMADGEERQRLSEEYDEIAAAQLETAGKADKKAKPQIVRRDAGSSTSEGSAGEFEELSGSYGAPMIADPSTNFMNTSIYPSAEALNRDTLPGYSAQYVAQLSEEEYQRLLEGLKAADMLDPDIRRRRIAALSRASERRSGTATSDQ